MAKMFTVEDVLASLAELVEREKREVGYHAGVLDAALVAIQLLRKVGQEVEAKEVNSGDKEKE
jgi:hypothetical protein